MNTPPILNAPNDHPVEVLVEGVWCAGELTMWRKRDDRDPAGWYASVTWSRGPGQGTYRDVFHADQVREDTVDRSRGRSS